MDGQTPALVAVGGLSSSIQRVSSMPTGAGPMPLSTLINRHFGSNFASPAKREQGDWPSPAASFSRKGLHCLRFKECLVAFPLETKHSNWLEVYRMPCFPQENTTIDPYTGVALSWWESFQEAILKNFEILVLLVR